MSEKVIYYTGIGSRSTPGDVLAMMKKIGQILGKKGYVLRSGAAEGADSAFEQGCDSVGGLKEIYLPWKEFNGSNSDLYESSSAAEEIAFQYHPNLYACKHSVIKLMARNSHQVLGKDCRTKSSFVVCYCPLDEKGKWKGGTGQALRIASDKKIPIFNLYIKEELENLKSFLAQMN